MRNVVVRHTGRPGRHHAGSQGSWSFMQRWSSPGRRSGPTSRPLARTSSLHASTDGEPSGIWRRFNSEFVPSECTDLHLTVPHAYAPCSPWQVRTQHVLSAPLSLIKRAQDDDATSRGHRGRSEQGLHTPPDEVSISTRSGRLHPRTRITASCPAGPPHPPFVGKSAAVSLTSPSSSSASLGARPPTGLTNYTLCLPSVVRMEMSG